MERTGARPNEASAYTHVFLQGGVGGMAAGLVSYLWEYQDEQAVRAMRILAKGSGEDVPIVAGESGTAGLAVLETLRQDVGSSELVGLDAQSRVLIINTEGATAPLAYQQLVGQLARQPARHTR